MIDILVDEGIALPMTEEQVIQAVQASCVTLKQEEKLSLCVRFSSDEEVQSLNAQWRNMDKVTDVLSFPMQDEEELDIEESLGDIILAVPFVQQEAERLKLSLQNHITHLIVHGTLHLLGYDHINDAEAVEMQQLENQVMNQLGLHIPYPDLNEGVSPDE